MAQDANEEAAELIAPASNYRPLQGDEFFLLSETSFGTQDEATVRLEINADSYDLQDNGGVDIRVYKVPNALAFLKAQRNLHRIKVPSKVESEGMANMLRVAWDKIWVNARFAWRRMLSSASRAATTQSAPELKTSPELFTPTRLVNPVRYPKLSGYEVVDQFRYPVGKAKVITAPSGVALEGSSSQFLETAHGNVRIPLGRRAPGLYLVEATLGKYRALTLVFVSDSIALTKNSSNEMFTWVANRSSGAPLANAQVAWSDGVGVLKADKTNSDGIVRLQARSPETSYVFGVDEQGGVFISENFYHDSEIYNAKLFAITDRPLYRPGDLVQVKFMGREFQNARQSKPVAAGPLQLKVVDPTGTELFSQQLAFSSDTGAQTSFRLPVSAEAGGWDLIFTKGDDQYGAAFRVAHYVKPHFEVAMVMDQTDYKTRQPVSGTVQLTYPDGSPVRQAQVKLSARAQALSMVAGDLRYGGQFPLAIKVAELQTDNKGRAKFNLPEAQEPSRYLLSILAQDGAAYRVRADKEILVERSAHVWQISAPTQFSEPGKRVNFSFTSQSMGDDAASNRPVHWEAQRLEDRSVVQGDVPAQGNSVAVDFATSGSYTVRLRNSHGSLVAATSHWVTGQGLQAAPGTVEIVMDKEAYQLGDVAHALVTFAQPVEHALLTLERDKVEASALLSQGASWLKTSRVTPKQWRIDIPVREDFAPNMTFSVLYAKDGDYVFQNKGLQVRSPAVEVLVKPERENYAPGDMVKLVIQTRQAGKPVPAQLTVGVVDEMVYVLQPEIAPTMAQFFYHPRRNSVRTAASQSFIGYDLARMPANGQAPVQRTPSERGLKVLERPKRDDQDTAAWWPSLQTDASGLLNVSFRMPDALTRWRITARAMDSQGLVGQSVRHVTSSKPFYVQWSGPSVWREGDKVRTNVLAFNQTGAKARLQFSAKGAGFAMQKDVDLEPGINSIVLDMTQPVTGDVEIALMQNANLVDSMHKQVQVKPQGWTSERSLRLDAAVPNTSVLKLPADATGLRLHVSQGAQDEFLRMADDLLDQPWGGVEQTASRLLPLSLVFRSLPADAPGLSDIQQSLVNHRMRLVQMAGPEAMFGWWGIGTKESAWLTAYAYYADWHAARALGLSLPALHWEQVQSAYTRNAESEPLPMRALAVWFMQDMGLTTHTLTEGLVRDAQSWPDLHKSAESAGGRAPATPDNVGSTWLGDGKVVSAATLVLIDQLARKQKIGLPDAVAQRVEAARAALQERPGGSGLALLAMDGRVSKDAVRAALAAVGAQAPTLDRALSLVWWSKVLGGVPPAGTRELDTSVTSKAATDGWTRINSRLGASTWRWTGTRLPTQLPWGLLPADAHAVLRYRSALVQAEGNDATSTLPVRIERKLFRLVPVSGDKATSVAQDAGRNQVLAGSEVEFKLEPTKDTDIRANELYMEEFRLSAKGDMPRYGLLEIPLPPGADVERSTWGIRIRNLDGNGEVVSIERATGQAGDLSYAVPIDVMQSNQPIRHLLRFGSKGSFVLPPARYQRMYQPQDKAFETTSRRVQVQ